ncbi:MAG: hypothetical protein JWP12_1545 [Bacteroidetes bacterium]|nr:hypothetical protein [Bacteroidota bacterium]
MTKKIRLILLIFLTCLSISGQAQKNKNHTDTGQNADQKINPKEIKILIDSLSNALNNYYVFSEKASLMSNYLKSRYKSGAYNNINDRQQLAYQLYTDLQQAHKDEHMDIKYAPQFAQHLETPMSDSEKQQGRERGLSNARESNFAFTKTEILPGNIGYIRFDGFTEFIEDAKPTLKASFQFVKYTKALIIDLRYNGGGDAEMSSQIESYFFSKKTRMNDIIDRFNDTTYEMYADPAKTDSFTLSMPVYILTSKQTFSAAEDFSYGMQSVKRAIIVGDTTGGGAHPTLPFSVGQGFVALIPYGRAYNIITKTDWEGTGVRPDIAIPSEEALQKTQALIFTELISKAKDEREKNILQWNLNRIRSEMANKADPLVLNSYSGIYEGGLDFYVKDGYLFCKNAERRNMIFQLKYIDNNLFILDDNVQIQFEKDAAGVYSKIKMFWKSGNVSEKSKM